MEIVLLIIGIIIGTVVGYLAADRKSAALRAEISGTKKEIELLKLQKEEAEALHKRMNTEFENLSNRIFQSKAEDFTRLNTEHLGNLLRPLGDNLKDFRQKVEQVYSTEAKERFSLGERIKELVELNNRLSEDANNLTRALKGDSKMQGNWGEMILERLLQASGLIEGEHYFRQEFLKDERGEAIINEEYGFLDRNRGKESFLEYFRSKMADDDNFRNWNTAYKHFEKYCCGSCTFDDLTLEYCQGFLT